MSWSYHNPTRITFGAGSIARIGELVAGRPYVLVTYGQPVFAEIAGRIARISPKPLTIIDNIDTNPDFQDLTSACHSFLKNGANAEVIVALGGGSVIDTAKVLAAADGDFQNVQRFLQTGENRNEMNCRPVIAIPTTAGTGSEVTPWATVWDSQAKTKYSLNLPELFPEHALIDPNLMLGLPRQLTISTGLDALSHALESIWNVNANPVSTAFAINAATQVFETLPALAGDLGSLELRTLMASAALYSGLAFSNTKTALAHSLSYPVTLNHGIPHGIACSFSLPMVMRWIAGADQDCDAALVRIFGDDLMAGADRLDAFLLELGVAIKPGDYGIGKDEWRNIVKSALAGDRGRNFLGDSETVFADL
ncbi:MAG: phosphonoacetaldehyde reductase [Hyphomicrobiales bacterium]|nr:phosphonoacetaldehyde reductase [Hyphomicrobiales bacterium]